MDESHRTINPLFHWREADDRVELALSGELTVAVAAPLYAELLTLLRKDKDVEADGAAVEKIDTAIVQLLLAFRLELRHRRRTLRWSGASAALAQGTQALGLAALLDRNESTASPR